MKVSDSLIFLQKNPTMCNVKNYIIMHELYENVFCLRIMILVLYFLFTVWRSLGVTSSQLCKEMMVPMKEEFVYELDDNEKRLNQEIDDLFDGLDLKKSKLQHKSQRLNSHSSTTDNVCGNTTEKRLLHDPKDMFQQHVSVVFCSVDKSVSNHDSVTMSDVYQQSVNNHEMEIISGQNQMPSPIIQTFISSGEKSSEHYFLDTLEDRNEVKMDTSEVMEFKMDTSEEIEVKMEEKMETAYSMEIEGGSDKELSMEIIQVSFLRNIIYFLFLFISINIKDNYFHN